jgi:hypothetical protein
MTVTADTILIHTYHSRFIPEGVAEASQILLRDAHVLPKLLSCEGYCGRDKWSIAVWSRSSSGVSAVNPSLFMTSMEVRERCYPFILSRTLHETTILISRANKPSSGRGVINDVFGRGIKNSSLVWCTKKNSISLLLPWMSLKGD